MQLTKIFCGLGGLRVLMPLGTLTVLSALVGCEGTVDATGVMTSEAVVTPGMPMQTNGIGAAGGQVTSPDGRVTLIVPAGALASPVNITVTSVSPDSLGALFDDFSVAAAYDMQPSGTTFAEPVQVRVSSPDTPIRGMDGALSFVIQGLVTAEAGEVIALDAQSIDLPANTSTATVSGQLTHFSPLVLVDRFRTATGPEPVEVATAEFSFTDLPAQATVDQFFTPTLNLSSALVRFVGAIYDDFSERPLVADIRATPFRAEQSSEVDLIAQPRFTCASAGISTVSGRLDLVVNNEQPPELANGGLFGRVNVTAAVVSSPVVCVEPDDPPPPPLPPQGALPSGFLDCEDAARCAAQEQGSLLQGKGALVPPWERVQDPEPAPEPEPETCRIDIQPCAFGPYQNPQFVAVVASGDGPMSAIDLESGNNIGTFLGGQDPFFGPNRHFVPIGALPVVPDVENAQAGATVITYGRAIEGSLNAGRIQRANPPPEEFRDPRDPNDFGQEFTHISGNDFFLDARTFGGDLVANGGLLASDSGLRLFRFTDDPRVFSFNTFRFVDIGPVLSAEVINTDTVNPGPALALQDSATDGALLQHVDLNTADVTTVGSLGPNPRQLRCAGGLCFATSAGTAGEAPSQLKWWQWNGAAATVTELGELDLGGTGAAGEDAFAQVIGLDVIEFDNGNLGAVAFGFANGTVYEVAVTGIGAAQPGVIARQGQTQTSSACPNPGHGRWTVDAGTLKWVAFCNGGGGVEIGAATIGAPDESR